ncbi:MAG: hypothetical protein HY080_03365 [Gammaproteobacteria bacterium]|nr:hypothetical protein [Gammaproteobacteria bacterium]
MRTARNKLLGIVLILSLGACQQHSAAMQQVYFIQQETGIDPYRVRMSVNKDFLRIDDVGDATGYVLYDRVKNRVYSVNHTSRTVMLIEPRVNQLQPPFALQHTEVEQPPLKDSPKINNTSPQHRQYLTNKEVCMDVISVDGLLPDVVKALSDYQLALAADSASTFYQLPADMQTPCDISNSTFSPVRQYSHGFPIREWRPDGYARTLDDYTESVPPVADMFVIPKEYFAYTVQQFRDGQVDLQQRKILTPPQVQATTK